jgi:superfamily II DNA helicase RecQ
MKAMTATLRPGDKLQVSKMLGIDIHHFKELRQSSRRSEVAISSRFYQDKRALLLGLRTYLMNVSKIPASRVLIFVMTIKEAEDVGDILGQDHPSEVSICYSRRRDVVKRFAVATSCFGHGVNVAGLTHVVVLRSSWSVEGFVQVGN